MSDVTDEQRAKFEAWAKDNQYSIERMEHAPNRYADEGTDDALSGWMACAALTAQEGTGNGFENMRQAILNAIEDYCAESPDLAGHGHSGGLKDAVNEAIRNSETLL